MDAVVAYSSAVSTGIECVFAEEMEIEEVETAFFVFFLFFHLNI